MSDEKSTAITVGAEAVLVAHWPRLREITRVRIIRETPHFWVDQDGDRYRKKDLALVPRYIDEQRGIMSAAAFDQRNKAPGGAS